MASNGSHIVHGFPVPFIVTETGSSSYVYETILLTEISGGTSIVVDMGAALEYYLSLRSDAVIPAEVNTSLFMDKLQQVGILSSINADQRIQLENLGSILTIADAVIRVEFLALNRSDVTPRLESTVLSKSDAIAALESLISVSKDAIVTAEIKSSVQTDARPNVESTVNFRVDLVTTIEEISSLLSDKQVLAEFATKVSVDSSPDLEFATALRTDAIIWMSLLSSLRVDQFAQLEEVVRVNADARPNAEVTSTLAAFMSDGYVNIEITAASVSDLTAQLEQYIVVLDVPPIDILPRTPLQIKRSDALKGVCRYPLKLRHSVRNPN